MKSSRHTSIQTLHPNRSKSNTMRAIVKYNSCDRIHAESWRFRMNREPVDRKVVITVGVQVFDAVLNASDTAQRMYDALPVEGQVNRWGDEIYFSTGVRAAKSDATQQEMEVGDLAFWP